MVVRGLRKLGMQITDAEHRQMHYYWRYVGHLLGVDDALLTVTTAEQEIFALQIVTHLYRPTENGEKLMKALLTNMAKAAGLPWDCVLSAEVFRHYKPDPETYLGVCEVFDIRPEQMLMVACHKDDLRAAASHGCQTAFVERPLEYGAGVSVDLAVEPDFQFHAVDFNDLADQLGC